MKKGPWPAPSVLLAVHVGTLSKGGATRLPPVEPPAPATPVPPPPAAPPALAPPDGEPPLAAAPPALAPPLALAPPALAPPLALAPPETAWSGPPPEPAPPLAAAPDEAPSFEPHALVAAIALSPSSNCRRLTGFASVVSVSSCLVDIDSPYSAYRNSVPTSSELCRQKKSNGETPHPPALIFHDCDRRHAPRAWQIRLIRLAYATHF